MRFSEYRSDSPVNIVKLLRHLLDLSFQSCALVLIPLESLIINLNLSVKCLDLQAESIKLALLCLRSQVIGCVIVKSNSMMAHCVLLLYVLDQTVVLDLLLSVLSLQILYLLVSLSYLCFEDGRIVDKVTLKTLF